MNNHIIIEETITVTKKIKVSIDIHNYEEITKDQKGKIFGTLINWLASEKAKQEIKTAVKKQILEKLKPEVEKNIHSELSAQLPKEITQKLNSQLAEAKIKATVSTSVENGI